MTKRAQKGFTLIELLVVIAIIGLLAAVVLAAVGTARTKGADAAVKAQLNGARSQAELWSSSHNGYTGVCAGTGAAGGMVDILANALAQTNKGGAVRTGSPYATVGAWNDITCSEAASGASYVIAAPLSASASGAVSLWCVDSNGTAKVEAVVIPASSVSCP